LKKAEDKADKAELEKKIGDAQAEVTAMDELAGKLDETLKQIGPDLYKQAWQENQAYASDVYRLIASKEMCLQCHEVAGTRSSCPRTASSTPPCRQSPRERRSEPPSCHCCRVPCRADNLRPGRKLGQYQGPRGMGPRGNPRAQTAGKSPGGTADVGKIAFSPP